MEAPWGNTLNLISDGWTTVTELKAKRRTLCTSRRDGSRLSQGSKPTNMPHPRRWYWMVCFATCGRVLGKPNIGRWLPLSSSFLGGVGGQVETSKQINELPLFMHRTTVKVKVVLLISGDQGLGHSYSRTLYSYSEYPKHGWKGIHSGDTIWWDSWGLHGVMTELIEKTHP